jgi:DNA-binding NarL/FixJ family response regulator
MPPVKVLIAEDHALVREGLKMLLSLNPALLVVGDTGDGTAVRHMAEELQPDLVLLDLDLPQCHGTEVTTILKQQFPQIKVLILTGSLHPASVCSALAAGADGYVVKHENSDELLRAIPAVLAGQCFISQAVADAVDDSATPAAVLTPREQEILTLLARGKSNQEVADWLSLSVHTVRTHRQNILEKLDLHNAAEMTAWAIRHIPAASLSH